MFYFIIGHFSTIGTVSLFMKVMFIWQPNWSSFSFSFQFMRGSRAKKGRAIKFRERSISLIGIFSWFGGLVQSRKKKRHPHKTHATQLWSSYRFVCFLFLPDAAVRMNGKRKKWRWQKFCWQLRSDIVDFHETTSCDVNV